MSKAGPTTGSMDALPFLMGEGGADSKRAPAGPISVIMGDDGFLRHEARKAFCDRLLGSAFQDSGDSALSLRMIDGGQAEWGDILDALCERSLFGTEKPMVVVEDADPWVQRFRTQLEEYLDRPARGAHLVLDLLRWPGNTRLAKKVARGGLTIRCHAPQQGRERTTFVRQLKEWLIFVAQTEHQARLERPAADLLLEQLPTEAGILYQEVAKLALWMNPANQTIDRHLVTKHVGNWRARKTWDMIDAAVEGRASDALLQLDRLIASGEAPHALLPQMASTLRRFASAVRLYEHAERHRGRLSLKMALEKAGIPKFKLHAAEGQLRQIGRQRARKLYHWLLEADLGLKGYNAADDRARRVIETLIVRLSRQAA